MTPTPESVEEALAFFAKGQSFVGHSKEARHGFVLAAALRESRAELERSRKEVHFWKYGAEDALAQRDNRIRQELLKIRYSVEGVPHTNQAALHPADPASVRAPSTEKGGERK